MHAIRREEEEGEEGEGEEEEETGERGSRGPWFSRVLEAGRVWVPPGTSSFRFLFSSGRKEEGGSIVEATRIFCIGQSAR